MKPIKKALLLFSIFIISFSSLFILTDYIYDLNKINFTNEDELENKNLELYTSESSLPNRYNFTYYKVITLNHTKVSGLNNLTNFPVFISIFDTDLHDDVQPDGDDIAFANDTSWLDHEIELFNQDFNSTHAQLIAWVRIPLLTVSVDINITMYYGNPYITSQDPPTGVWDENYKGVWHMNEINGLDSTSNNNDGTQAGGVSNLEGIIAGSNYFEGVNDLITIGNVGSGIKTIEFWMNPSNLGSLDPIIETSWKNPTGTGDDYDEWSNPTYAFTSDDSYSIAGQNDYQDWYNFTFNIPDGATINGIQLEIEASQSSPAGGSVALSWDGGSTYTSSESYTWISSGDNNGTFGGPTEDWGETWSSEELNNSNFRVRIQRSSHAIGTLAVDCIYVKVYYDYEFMRIIDLDGISRIEIVEEKLLTTNFPGTQTIYIDGVVDSSLTADWHYIVITNSIGLDVSAMKIGEVSSDFFEGKIDELRVSNISRTPDSFNTSYFNQNNPTSFCNINQEFDFNTDPPVYSNLTESSNQLELGETEVISINITDPAGIRQVKIAFESSNNSMTHIGGDNWSYDAWTPSQKGNFSYVIYMEDNTGIWNSVNDSILVIDTTLPTYSNLTESADPLELGDTIIISVNASDISGIHNVSIEFEGSNHSMTNIAAGDNWSYNVWTPSQTGNYSYTIFIEDNNNHTISIIDNIITVQDSISPTYSNLFKSADPLEIGDNIIISVEASDISGIHNVSIEFESSNHSMTNIGGDLWQYDLWTPSQTANYSYTIFIEDNNNHMISLMGNITVQDTTPPSAPTMIQAPSGGINQTLTFDWESNFDYSGISYFILIIDNESDPDITEGYVLNVNITNTGPESSYYELTEGLPVGTYYYFLSQIDGVGQQSDFITGSFEITSSSGGGNITILDLLPYILAILIGSVTTIVIVRRRIQSRLHPKRKKILLKSIISHINKISGKKPISKNGEQKKKTDNKLLSKKEKFDEKELENRLIESKTLGKELFEEGAFLEAQKHFKQAEVILMKLERNEEANYFSKIFLEIDELNDKREKKLEILEQEILANNIVIIIDLYFDLIDISKQLKDFDSIEMYQSELTQLYDDGKLTISDLKQKRDKLESEAILLLNQQVFQEAANRYENCEEISQFLVKLGREEEITNLEKYRKNKNDCIRKSESKL